MSLNEPSEVPRWQEGSTWHSLTWLGPPRWNAHRAFSHLGLSSPYLWTPSPCLARDRLCNKSAKWCPQDKGFLAGCEVECSRMAEPHKRVTTPLLLGLKQFIRVKTVTVVAVTSHKVKAGF